MEWDLDVRLNGQTLWQALSGAARCLIAALAALFAAGPAEVSAEAARAALNFRAEKILDTYGNSLLRLAYSYLHNRSDAEEVPQDTLLQFLKTAPSFESGEHEKAWLLRVAANLSKNRIRYNRVRDADELDEELAADGREDLSFVWEAVRSLPEPYRETVHLFYEEGLSTAQIAAVLHANEATVRSHLTRARARLRDILKEAYDFGE